GRIRFGKVQGFRPLRLLAGMLFLAGPWLALARLHAVPEVGPGLMMFLLVLVWIADSAAYFSGRALGRHKLAPAISPGKTVEGALGALASAVIPAAFLVWAGWVQAPAWMLVLLCIFTVGVSIGGDLWESVLKRERGVKDSGNLLPGHGGVLDRIDSQIAASPFFVAGLVVGGMPL
ncbi:MAG TPA: phosphatidate cytidylyltransferase, partial [Chromatiaceae bacterium]|nr:phosphatidate cytidylyltransferase [Chromatiaceae bacterium]